MTNPRLLTELQKGEYWHCTCPTAFSAILNDSCIKPATGRSRFGIKPSAAQYLRAVPLFDWLAPRWEEVLDRPDIWSFFGMKPFTVAIGVDPSQLPNKILRYPATKDLTSMESAGEIIGGPFPFVEVLHRGPVPITAMTRVLAISARIHHDFQIIDKMDMDRLLQLGSSADSAAFVPTL